MTACRCGCAADTHLHFRAGTDCGACGPAACAVFVPADFTDAQAEAYVALAPYATATHDIPEHAPTDQGEPS